MPRPLARLTSPAVVGVALLAGNLYALVGVVLPAFHPAPVRTLASGDRVMVPSLREGLAVLEGDSHWLVTGEQPAWLAHVEVRAEAFTAFEVELAASAPDADQRACLDFATTERPIPENPPACVDWLADGRGRAIRIELRGRPGWTQRVTHLKLRLFRDGVATGTDVWTRRPRLIAAAPADGAPGDTP